MSNYRFKAKSLNPLKKSRFLSNFGVFDIETSSWLDNTVGVDPEIVNSYHNKFIDPFLLVYYNGSDFYVYKYENCVKDFLKDFLTHKNRGKIVFSHNGGKFDTLAVYQVFVGDPFFYERFDCQPLLQGSRIMSFKVWDSSGHVWDFRDSFSLLPKSLDSLCHSFKPDHVKLERPQVDFSCDPKTWVNYCKYDCLSLYEILLKFDNVIRDIGGCIGYTIASTSLRTFRKRFLKTDLETYYEYNDFFKRGYYGGRTEVFRMIANEIDSPFYVYDVNSMYPFIMRSYDYPVSRPMKINPYDVDEFKGQCGVAHVEVNAPPDLYFPVLPYHREDKKLVFPLGSWEGVYEFNMLNKAVKMGYDVKTKYAWVFDTQPLFKGYVDYFYRLKNNSEEAEREIYKFLLNTLYGKFAEKSERSEIITNPDVNLTGLLPFDTVFGYAIKKNKSFSPYHLPMISIMVTSLAQLRLYEYFEKIINRGGKIFYCDTDSIVTDIRIDTDDRLGGLKLENTFKRGIFLAPKTYYLELFDTIEGNDKKIRIKGFTNNVKNKINKWEVWHKALTKQDFTPFYEQKIRPASLNEIRIRHLNGFVTLLDEKTIKNVYDKRQILEDFNTIPLIV